MVPDLAAFQVQLHGKPLKEAIPLFRKLLKESQSTLKEAFQMGASMLDLLKGRAALVDFVLKQTWNTQGRAPVSHFALVAVGGFGRSLLHPGSDVDVLLLFSQNQDKKLAIEFIAGWLTTLWDIGLEVGHSVRTFQECIDEGLKDVTVATNLMEARLLLGAESLFDEMTAETAAPKIWPSKIYFEAKYQEQLKRHKKYHDTAYNLEPNVKGTPGGLRDLQTIEWIAMRHFGTSSWADWVQQGFLLEPEYQTLMQSREFLWRIRFALHILAGRREDRLLFDYQRQVATLLGYQDIPNHLAVEQLMKKYYQTVMQIQTLNGLLLQVFKENFNNSEKKAVTGEFKDPKTLFQFFCLWTRQRDPSHLSSNTIRLLCATGRQLEAYTQQSTGVKRLFLRLLNASSGANGSLRLMKQYGILGAYLPEFAAVTGRMQYDLFHVYTVDEHTLFVIERIYSFYQKKHQECFPLCHTLMRKIQKPALLAIAALFHDIAKGRGGDHSLLGALDAEQFCSAHELNLLDTQLVVWLVAHHLLLSMTAQKRDLSDPQVIGHFAKKVQDQKHLDYLYILTCADISATNPKLWNTWRASLLRELYEATSAFLQGKLKSSAKFGRSIKKIKEDASDRLKQRGVSLYEIDKIWVHWDEEFFLRLTSEDIAWQTEAICRHQDQTEPLVLVRNPPGRGATEIFVYCKDRDYLFATITTVLAQLDLSIVDAQIMGDNENHLLDTFFVLENFGTPVHQEERQIEIREALISQLRFSDRCLLRPHRAPSRLIRHFSLPTTVQFEADRDQRRTVLELTTLDKPGLLAIVGQVFFECGVILHRAKISTVGEKVEDVFYVTTQKREVLSSTLQKKLKGALIKQLG